MWRGWGEGGGELDIVLTRTVHILTTNELVKLMMLLTTGPGFGTEELFS